MYVEIFVWPCVSRSSRRAAIGTLFRPPTLMPRRRTRYRVIVSKDATPVPALGCPGDERPPGPTSSGHLGRHDLQQNVLIGPFHTQRRGKGRDRRVPPTQVRIL